MLPRVSDKGSRLAGRKKRNPAKGEKFRLTGLSISARSESVGSEGHGSLGKPYFKALSTSLVNASKPSSLKTCRKRPFKVSVDWMDLTLLTSTG